MKHYYFYWQLVSILILYTHGATASHVIAYDVSYRHLTGNDYEIQLIAFQDCSNAPMSSTRVLNYTSTTCGHSSSLVTYLQSSSIFSQLHPTCSPSGSTACNSTLPGYKRGVYIDTISLPSACSDWVFKITDCCRSASFAPTPNPGNIAGGATLDNIAVANNSSPNTSNRPLFMETRVNMPSFYNLQAVDPDGDELRYRLSPALQDYPNLSILYLTSHIPPGNVSLDPITGILSVTCNSIGNYLLAYIIDEYRNGVLIGSTIRDIVITTRQFTLSNNTLAISNLSVLLGGTQIGDTIYIEENQLLLLDVTVTDPDNDPIEVDADLALHNCPGSFMTLTSATNPVVQTFAWTPTTVGTYPVDFFVRELTCPYSASFHHLSAIIEVIPSPSTITITSLVQPDSSITLCSQTPSLLGTIDTSYLIQSPNSGTFTAANNCITYQANSIPNITDTLAFVYCDSLQTCDTNYYVITTATCVWAGDTDTSKLVNNFDLLPIGLGFGLTETTRPNADLNFDCEPSLDWTTSTPVTNINYKHSDCDGNGTINGDDTLAIVLNWGLFHLRNGGNSHATGNLPIYVQNYVAVEGTTIQVPIMLGDSINPVDSAYGLAFTITYDPALIDSASVSVDFNTSWFGQYNTDMISVSKDFYTAGQIQVGLTRINQLTRSGYGQIGSLNLTIKDDIIRRSNNNRINLNVTNVRLISNSEIERGTTNPATSIAILDNTVLNQTVLSTPSNQVKVYPNPSKVSLTVEALDGQLELVELVSITGQRLASYNTQETSLQFSTQTLANGIYILQIRTDKGLQIKRIIVQH